MDDSASDPRDAPPLPATEPAEVVRLRLVPEDEPQPALLRELTELFAAAVAEEFGPRKPPVVTFTKPPRHEAAEQQQAVADAMEEIGRIAAASGPVAEQFKARVESHGPASTESETRVAEEQIQDAIRWCRENGLRPRVRTSRRGG